MDMKELVTGLVGAANENMFSFSVCIVMASIIVFNSFPASNKASKSLITIFVTGISACAFYGAEPVYEYFQYSYGVTLFCLAIFFAGVYVHWAGYIRVRVRYRAIIFSFIMILFALGIGNVERTKGKIVCVFGKNINRVDYLIDRTIRCRLTSGFLGGQVALFEEEIFRQIKEFYFSDNGKKCMLDIGNVRSQMYDSGFKKVWKYESCS